MAKQSAKQIDIDILDMEYQKALPHWLDPIEKYKGKHEAKRIKRQKEHGEEIMRKGKRR